MDKDAIVKFQSAGVSDSVIIGMISASPCSFDTSPDRIRPGAYKVTPSADLKPGAYAFVAALPGVTPETPPSMVV